MTSPSTSQSIGVSIQDALDQAQEALDAADYPQAMALAQSVALDQSNTAPGSPDHTRARVLISECLQAQGSLSDAVVCLMAALDDAERLGHAELVCSVKRNLAFTLSEGMGLYEPALTYASEAYEVAEAADLDSSSVLCLVAMAAICGRIGEGELGERLGLLALSLARDRNDNNGIWRALGCLAVVCNVVCSDPDQHPDYVREMQAKCLSYAHRSHRLAQQSGRIDAAVLSSLTLASAMVRSNLFEDAEPLLNETLTLARSHGLLRNELSLLREQAAMLQKQGLVRQAHQLLTACLDRKEFSHFARMYRHVLKLQVDCCKQLGLFEESMRHSEVLHDLNLRDEAMRTAARANLVLHPIQVDAARGVAVRLGQAPRTVLAANEGTQWMAAAGPDIIIH